MPLTSIDLPFVAETISKNMIDRALRGQPNQVPETNCPDRKALGEPGRASGFIPRSGLGASGGCTLAPRREFPCNPCQPCASHEFGIPARCCNRDTRRGEN